MGVREEMEEDGANNILPTEEQEYPLPFYKGACWDVIPWWAKTKWWGWKKGQIQSKLKYRFSNTGLLLFLLRLVSSGYHFLCHHGGKKREKVSINIQLISKPDHCENLYRADYENNECHLQMLGNDRGGLFVKPRYSVEQLDDESEAWGS